MKLNPHTPEQIITILDQAVKGEQTVAAMWREHGSAEHTFYRWRQTYGGMAVNEVPRWKDLEQENRRRNRLLAARMLENDVRKALLENKG